MDPKTSVAFKLSNIPDSGRPLTQAVLTRLTFAESVVLTRRPKVIRSRFVSHSVLLSVCTVVRL